MANELATIPPTALYSSYCLKYYKRFSKILSCLTLYNDISCFGLDTQTTRSKNSSSSATALPKKVSLDDMPTDFDHIFSSGSHLRLICPTCNTPRAFSSVRNCHSCKSELVVWYRDVTTTSWTKPRMPPNRDITGPYLECKHFLQGQRCVKNSM